MVQNDSHMEVPPVNYAVIRYSIYFVNAEPTFLPGVAPPRCHHTLWPFIQLEWIFADTIN